VLVTHDRYLLNRVASTVLGLDGEGHIEKFADYGQWEQWLEEQKTGNREQGVGSIKTAESNPARETAQKKKLSYLEAREFATIEKRVEASDERLASARSRVEDPAIASDAAALQAALAELDSAQDENDGLYARWADLTDKSV
jgi:ATP-binding cassette subfamily F protein uup